MREAAAAQHLLPVLQQRLLQLTVQRLREEELRRRAHQCVLLRHVPVDAAVMQASEQRSKGY
jgi:hypothetical protein